MYYRTMDVPFIIGQDSVMVGMKTPSCYSQRIRNTDILFIDEISMLSQRVFEQVALCFEIHM